jgi:hypothetical protein
LPIVSADVRLNENWKLANPDEHHELLVSMDDWRLSYY